MQAIKSKVYQPYLHVVQNKTTHRHLKPMVKQRLMGTVLGVTGVITTMLTGDVTPTVLISPLIVILLFGKHYILIN